MKYTWPWYLVLGLVVFCMFFGAQIMGAEVVAQDKIEKIEGKYNVDVFTGGRAVVFITDEIAVDKVFPNCICFMDKFTNKKIRVSGSCSYVIYENK